MSHRLPVTVASLSCGLFFIAVSMLAGLSGCGGGGGGDSVSTPPSSITLSLPASPLSGEVPIDYALTGSGNGDVTFSFSTDNGVTWSIATPAAGCATTKQLASPGSYIFTWDTVADSDLASGTVKVRAQIGSQSATASATITTISPTFLDRSASIDSAIATGTYQPQKRTSPLVERAN